MFYVCEVSVCIYNIYMSATDVDDSREAPEATPPYFVN